jgi:hypothetical protein
MKKWISFFLMMSLFSCASIKSTPNKQRIDIYILMGQSNMSGRGPLTEDNSKVENNRVLMLTEDLKWIPAKNPLHFDKPNITAVGPGLSFGVTMQEADRNTEIGLVPTAVGGTSINTWTPGGYDKATKKYPYDDAEKRILAAMKTGDIKGILWHQGESDSKAESAKTYLPKLIELIARVRKLTGNENLPFVVGQLGRYNPQYDNINRELEKLPALVPHTAVASSEGLTDKGDHTHFDAASAIELGKRFAAKMLALQKK